MERTYDWEKNSNLVANVGLKKPKKRKGINISPTVYEGDVAARNKWPLIGNPHIGKMASNWKERWLLEHKKTCRSCPDCKEARKGRRLSKKLRPNSVQRIEIMDRNLLTS